MARLRTRLKRTGPSQLAMSIIVRDAFSGLLSLHNDAGVFRSRRHVGGLLGVFSTSTVAVVVLTALNGVSEALGRRIQADGDEMKLKSALLALLAIGLTIFTYCCPFSLSFDSFSMVGGAEGPPG